MQGLGSIIRANGNASNVNCDGHGSPWYVDREGRDARSTDFPVVRVHDGAIIGTYPTLRKARKAVARLIRSTP